MVQKGNELVAIVDGEDNVLYVTERRIADRDGLRMRSARALIFDPEVKRTFVHRRAKTPVNAGLLDVGTAETPHVHYYAAIGMCMHESYSSAAARGFFEEGTGSKGSLESIIKDTRPIFKLPSIDIIDIPGRPRNYGVHAIVHNQNTHGPIIPEREEVEEWWWKTEPELRDMLNGEKGLMGIAPVMGQIAFYLMRNPGIMLGRIAIPINLSEVYSA